MPQTSITSNLVWLLATIVSMLAWPAANAAAQADELILEQDFSKAISQVAPYRSQGPNTTIQRIEDPQATGGAYLQGRLPGQNDLEGYHLNIDDMPAGRGVMVQLRVRGRGELMPSINARSGWMYGRKLHLTDQWQTISLTRGLRSDESQFSLHLISHTRQHDAVFELDLLRVFALPVMQARDQSVPPQRFRAVDFSAHHDRTVSRDDAIDQQVLEHGTYMQLDALPFPRTTQPVTVHARVLAASPQDRVLLRSGRGSGNQVIASVRPQQAGQWEWVRLENLQLEQVGQQFRLDYFVDRQSAQQSVLDAVVITTEPMDAADLDRVLPLNLARPAITARPLAASESQQAWWEYAPQASHFVRPQSLAPAEADTRFAVGYDDQALHVRFMADEPTLEVAAQRRHEFRAQVTDRDGPVFNDESLLFMVQPEPDGPVYEFAANALGTLADARCEFPDLWSAGRDTEWQSSATVEAQIEDGYWTLQFRIPWSDLGVTRPEPGQRWNVIVARVTRSRDDTASWNPSGVGAHAPLAMGQLFFGTQTPGMTVTAPGSLSVGQQHIKATLRGDQPDAYLLRTAARQDRSQQIDYQLAALEPGSQTELAEAITFAPGDVALSYSLLHAGTLQPIYHARPTAASVTASQATLTLSTAGPWRLWHNGRTVAQNSMADQQQITIALQVGANSLALEVETGQAQIHLDAPNLDADQVRWRINHNAPANATADSFDDARWALAEPDTQGILGQSGESATLRHTLLWQETRHWPTPDPVFHLARNSVQHVNLIIDGLDGRPLHGFEIYFAVPPAFEVLGSSAYYGRLQEQMHSYETDDLGTQTIDGQTMRLYRFRADGPIRAGRHHIMSLAHAFVRYREEAGEPAADERFPFVYWTRANDGSVLEARQTTWVKVLAPLAGKQPQNQLWQLWGSFFNALDNHDMAEAILQTMRQAGMNQIVGLSDWLGPRAKQHDITQMVTVVFRPWSLNVAPYLQQHPDHRLVAYTGEPDDGLMCMTVLLDEGWPVVDDLLANYVRNLPDVAAVWYDYEFSPFGKPHGCFCLRCREQFASHLAVSVDSLPDGPTIREQHQDAWTDFMARRASRLNRLMKQTVNATPPHPQFGVYSGYQTPENPLRYGIDWRYVAQDQAADIIGLGYGRPMPAVFDTTRIMGDVPAVYGAIVRPYRTSELRPLIPVTQAQLLRRALDATGGVLVYDRLPMDGRCWLAIAETTRLVAEFEDHFALPHGMDIPGVAEPYGRAVQVGNTTLVCLMNTLTRDQTWSVDLPADWGAGRSFYQDETITAGQTVTVTLEPGEVAVYVLQR